MERVILDIHIIEVDNGFYVRIGQGNETLIAKTKEEVCKMFMEQLDVVGGK